MSEKPTTVTKEQIAVWKKKYGKIFCYTSADGKKCYLRAPDRRIIAASTVSAGNDNLYQKELVIKNCLLGGDETLLTEDKYFYVFAQEMEKSIEIVEGELKEV